MDARLEEIKAILKKYGQEHLLNHYDKLDDVHKQKLLEEIENIDFELVDSLYRSTEKKEKIYSAKVWMESEGDGEK